MLAISINCRCIACKPEVEVEEEEEEEEEQDSEGDAGEGEDNCIGPYVALAIFASSSTHRLARESARYHTELSSSP